MNNPRIVHSLPSRESAPPVFCLTTMDPGTFTSPPGPPPGVTVHYVDEDGHVLEREDRFYGSP
jgi:hypothetical protein